MNHKKNTLIHILIGIIVCIIIALILALVYKKQEGDNTSDVLHNRPLTEEEFISFAESLKATTTPSAEEIREMEIFAESLIGTSTWDTMTPEQQAEIIKHAESLKAQ